jgi:malonyl CoA-acyl carrier protein transacylase
VSLPIAVLLCPGRGSYGKAELGCIGRWLQPGAVADALDHADRARREQGRPTVRELDAAEKFKPGTHLDGDNAAELIYFATMSQLQHLQQRYRIVAVAGNSLGWYTALPASRALDPTSGWRLVTTMAALQKQIAGGQVLTTTVGDDWRADTALVRGVDQALAAALAKGTEYFCARSIRLGGHEVLAGTERGIAELLATLPQLRVGEREFPFRLAGHGPFHTVLCASTAMQAQAQLADLPMREPAIHLIDGFGNLHTPWSADPRELLDYTLKSQVLETFDFTAAVRTAIREFNPNVLLCAGPGTSLRAPVGHVVIREGWRGIGGREELFASGVVAME